MNEREEHEAEQAKLNSDMDRVRGEVRRIASEARSLYMVAVSPAGELVNLCFFQGYADIRAMQVESREQIMAMIQQHTKKLPSQAV
jgi:hypothetical protein